MRWTKIFEDFEYFDNILITNILYSNLLFPPQNHTQNPLTFQFMFRRTSWTANYTLLNIFPESHRFLPQKQEFFKFQRAVLKSSAH